MKQIDNYTVVRQLSSLVEYLYRKGVYDGATCGDSRLILECADREDNYTTLRFLSDEGGKILTRLYYNDLLRLYARKINCTYIARMFGMGSKPRFVNANFAYLADYFYRQGLKDGVNANPQEAEDLFLGGKSCSKHIRLNTRWPITTPAWIDEIKMGARRIQSEWEDVGIGGNGMLDVCRYIATTVMRHEAAENIKQGLDDFDYDTGPSIADL